MHVTAFDDNTQGIYVPFALDYTFDYARDKHYPLIE